jgi:hypothetical protein
MSFVRAMPNQYLLAGRGGRLENRGSAVQVFLRPGTVWVLVPRTKQEATFEFTQETRDGIPLRFKGLVVYRITDPIAAARVFELSRGAETGQINALLAHICLGELRCGLPHDDGGVYRATEDDAHRRDPRGARGGDPSV